MRSLEAIGFGPDDEQALDAWLRLDEPFFDEMCLMLMIAVWHQVERVLVDAAARIPRRGETAISRDTYQSRRHALRTHTASPVQNAARMLRLDNRAEWSALETLRRLAHRDKHEGGRIEPVSPRGKRPAPNGSLAESDAVRGELARSVDLHELADYREIAGAFINRAEKVLGGWQMTLCRVTGPRRRPSR
jgi:hypothetical protein